MSAEVDAAVVRLRREGLLSAEQAALFARVARRELVSLIGGAALLLFEVVRPGERASFSWTFALATAALAAAA